jgi:hypothetical protein
MEESQSSALRPSRSEIVAIAAVTVLLAVLVARGVQWGLDRHFKDWDLPTHAVNTALSNKLGIQWPHFLSYWILGVPNGFSSKPRDIVDSLPAVVGLLIAAKFAITYMMLRTGMGFRPRHQIAMVGIVALLLGVAFSLPVPNLYRGQLPANQFHNTTTFVVMPLALLTFWAACRFVRAPSNGRAAAVALLGLLSVAAKPNFAMAFVPAFPIHLQLAGVPRRWKVIGVAIAGALFVAVAAQYLWMYHSDSFEVLRRAAVEARQQDLRRWRVDIAPFRLWYDVSPFPAVSLLATLLFPLVALFARFDVARRSRELVFAWMLFGFALLQFIVFDEPGRPGRPANFRWGGIITAYILFLVTAALMLEPVRDRARSWRDTLAWCAFGLHVAAGVLILVHFAQTGSYIEYGYTWRVL